MCGRVQNFENVEIFFNFFFKVWDDTFIYCNLILLIAKSKDPCLMHTLSRFEKAVMIICTQNMNLRKVIRAVTRVTKIPRRVGFGMVL